jgi:phage/plasmid-like protein (TIGR03299 family)
MAHDLFKDSMVYVGAVPWHRLGRRIEPTASVDEFLKAGGLDWQVRAEPAPGAKPKARGAFSRYVIMRDAVGGEAGPVALGLVSNRYTPLQNVEAFAFFDPLIEQGWASYEAAGALRDGEVVWVQVRLRDDMLVAGRDRVVRYLLLRNRHDGRGSVSVRFTPVRVVCQNTLTFAEKHSPSLANVRHTASMHVRLQDVQADVVQQEIEAFSARAKRLFEAMMERRLTGGERLALLDKLCPRPAARAPVTHVPSRRDVVEQRLQEQAAVDPLAGVETLWGLYNAITWAEDERARLAGAKDAETGLTRTWFSSGADFKAEVLDALAVQAGGW